LLRQIDAVLDLSWLRDDIAPSYSHTGCPSVDPKVMVRMLVIGYCYSILSERRLCREVELNLAYRWFCGLSLKDKVLHLFGQSSRPLPRQRCLAQGVRECRPPVHGSRVGQGRGLFGGRLCD
jgi:transposase